MHIQRSPSELPPLGGAAEDQEVAMAETTAELLSVSQTAALLGLTQERVYTFIRAGRLPATRLGARTWIVRRQDAEAFAQQPRRPGRPPAPSPPSASPGSSSLSERTFSPESCPTVGVD